MLKNIHISDYRNGVRQGVAALLLSLVFFLVWSCNNSSQQDSPPQSEAKAKVNDLLLKGFKGRIKTIIEKSFQSPAHVLADDPFSIARTTMRSDGNYKKVEILFQDSTMNTLDYAYIEDSIIVRNRHTLGDSVLAKQFFVYLLNEEGVRYKILSFNADRQLLMTTTIIADKRGFALENQNVVQFAEDAGKIPCKEQFGYDAKGFLTEETWFRFNPETGNCEPTQTVRRYTNDERGNCVEEWVVKEDGTLLGKYKYQYKYDAVGNWVEKTSFADIQGKEVVRSVILREYAYE